MRAQKWHFLPVQENLSVQHGANELKNTNKLNSSGKRKLLKCDTGKNETLNDRL